jgi:hypothetical protein
MLFCVSTVQASEVYFGAFIDSSLRSAPNATTSAKYVSGVRIDTEFGYGLTPRLLIETLMDSANDDVSLSPTSVRYEVGLQYQHDSKYIDLSRMCWHSIDGFGTEDYWLLKVGAKW